MAIDKEYYKVVLLPITIAQGDYCWGKGDGTTRKCCGHFDNYGGHPICTLDIDQVNYNKKGEVEKPVKCKQLNDQ